ncbi:cyclin-dependent protein kinase inhibitor SMR1-like [Malania oleifera]|uniref:cyclin-dependent protein kinase inhibitor SMR1-like n=1 Tax=Malania oleifera TaxID=397392 RepID=UPI0025AEA5AA|nr:cyclin-dependent protein kinase inhibitor SMR1-like [Malania oleifera]
MDSQLSSKLSSLRLPDIQFRSPQQSTEATRDGGSVRDKNQQPAASETTASQGCPINNNPQSAEDSGGYDESLCRTPTSEEHKIPAVISCPPAPRRPRASPPRKRRLLDEPEFHLFVSSEELEEFFRSNFEVLTGAKRRSTCN